MDFVDGWISLSLSESSAASPLVYTTAVAELRGITNTSQTNKTRFLDVHMAESRNWMKRIEGLWFHYMKVIKSKKQPCNSQKRYVHPEMLPTFSSFVFRLAINVFLLFENTSAAVERKKNVKLPKAIKKRTALDRCRCSIFPISRDFSILICTFNTQHRTAPDWRGRDYSF